MTTPLWMWETALHKALLNNETPLSHISTLWSVVYYRSIFHFHDKFKLRNRATFPCQNSTKRRNVQLCDDLIYCIVLYSSIYIAPLNSHRQTEALLVRLAPRKETSFKK